jgi:hypothetical protein
LVTSIRSKVAFKAIGTNGLGVNVNGVVVDNMGKVITAFTSNRLGMGYFYLNPAEGKTYKAQLTYPDGTKNTGNLPVPVSNAMVLSADNELTEKAIIQLRADKAFFKANRNKVFTLLVYSGGVATTFLCRLNMPVVPIEILKSDLHTGVARATLFSAGGDPLSERLIFIQNNDQLNLEVNTDKPVYTKRGKVNVKVNASTSSGKAAKGHFSVSIIDESQVQVDEDTENNIMTNLLLTSEVKGYVEKPGYYFNNPSDETKADLDILMLTQGYRRFEWRQVFDYKPNQELPYQPENLLALAGTLKTASGKPVPNGKVILMAANDNLLRDTVADTNGNFKFTGLYLTDTPMVVLRARSENNGNNVKIELKQQDKPALSQPGNTVEIAQPASVLMRQKYALHRQENQILSGKAITLREVNIKGKKPPVKPVIVNSANLNGPGNANYIIMGDRLVNCMDLTCLYGKIPGTISKNGFLYRISQGERLSKSSRSPSMVIFIDGVPFTQEQAPFDMIDINNIYSIEALTSLSYLAVYGTEAPGGALIITMKQGAENAKEQLVPRGLMRFGFKGFYRSREFYSPKYDHPRGNLNQKDLRSTIYWAPELLTDKEGKASIEYFNADGPGIYRMLIEGVDDSGNLGRQVYRYKVE